MNVRLSRLHHPVTALGYGSRAGIWFQGCSIRCPGCLAVDTWSTRAGEAVSVDALLDWLAHLPDAIDGVTVSGGEPTDQPEALRELLEGVARLRDTRDADWDVLLYTGRSRKDVDEHLPWLATACDAVVVGPYVADLADLSPLRGSSNQEVHPLTGRGAARYGRARLGDFAAQRGEMNIVVDDDAIWLVGIPRPGDLPRLRAGLAGRGVHVAATSWLG